MTAALLEILPIILRFVQLAPQLQAALQLGQLDSALKLAPDLAVVLKQLGKLQFPGIADQLAHVAGAQALFDMTTVKWVQLSLNLLGADPKLLIDGSYGPATREAVKKFQTAHSLTPDGWAGEKTQDALREALQH
jgi:murein L,D-transpeptidase YcbB/YkuD